MATDQSDAGFSRRAAAWLAALIFLLVGALAVPTASPAADTIEAMAFKVEALAKAHKLDAAIALGRKLVAAARKSLGKTDPRLAAYLAELAVLEAQRGHLVDGEKLAREAIAISSGVAGPDGPEVLESLKALAAVLASGGDTKRDEAEALLARALAIAEGAFGPGSPEAADVQERLAALFESQGRTAEAQQLRQRIADANEARLEAERLRAEVEVKASADKSAQVTAQPPAQPVPEPGASQSTAEPPPPSISQPLRRKGKAPSRPSASPNLQSGEGPILRAAPAPRPAPPGGMATEAARAPQPAPEYHVVDIFFGTNRQPADGAVRVSFTSSEADGLTLGAARVTVPVTHQVPQVERPWALRVPGTELQITLEVEDPTRHFTIKSIEALPEDAFLARVKDRLSESQAYKDQALVFVHGFYNTFDDALYRTAQITYDMQFDGAAFMFSWPSAGTLEAYRSDQPKAKAAGTQLRAFLDLVARKSGAKRITVIAHSMGNLPLMEALDGSFAPEHPLPDAMIDDVVLAAPDISRSDFAKLAEHMARVRGGITLYAASNDLALAASRTVNGGEGRAGDTRPDGPLVVPHMDTIDATGASMQMFRLNHYYVAESSAVLCDLERLLRTGLHPPDARTRLLTPVEEAAGRYYQFR